MDKFKAVTFSYDDGCENDGRLIELLNRHGMKETFHLCGISYKDCSVDELKKTGEVPTRQAAIFWRIPLHP